MTTLIIPRKQGIIVPQRIVLPWEIYGIRQAPQPTPVDVYHAAWETARALSYDTDRYGDWDQFEHKFCDQIRTIDDAVKFANEAYATLDDPYTRFLGPKKAQKQADERQGTLTGIGVVFETKEDEDGNIVIGRVLEDGPAHNAGILPGDALKKVGRFLVKNMTREKMIERITGEEGTKVKLTIVREGEELEFEVTRGIINIPAVRPERVGEDYKVLYLKFSTFMQDDTVDEMRQALEENDDAEAIVIGVRFNPGGQVIQCIRVLSLFIEEGVLVKMRQRIPYRGFQTTVYRLTKDKLIVERTIEDTGKTFSQEMPRDPYLAGDKPVVVLTDKWSASASEMLAGALKDHGRATLIGKTTYGKGIGQTPQPLLEGTVAVVTSLRYFSPNGHWAGDAHKEKIGIAPHIEVDLPEGVMPGSPEDAQLNRALEVIEEQLKG